MASTQWKAAPKNEEYLVFGFVRESEEVLSSLSVIPEITRICLSYFFEPVLVELHFELEVDYEHAFEREHCRGDGN